MVASSASIMDNRSSAYDRYKKTTRSFRDRLASLVPFPLVSVSDLYRAANHAYNAVLMACKNGGPPTRTASRLTSLEFHCTILQELTETITLREHVGSTYSDDYNDGHKYIIKVLHRCRQKLKASQQTLRRAYGEQKLQKTSASAGEIGDKENRNGQHADNRSYGFESLRIENDEDFSDEEDDSDDDRDSPSASDEELHPKDIIHDVQECKKYSIEDDLIKGSLAFQANMFFIDAEGLFSIAVNAYKELDQKLSETSDHGQHATAILQATAVINLVLENVVRLEKSLHLESGTFENIYQVFAVLIFQRQISEMEAILGQAIVAKNPKTCLSICGQSIRFGLLSTDALYASPMYTGLVKDLLSASRLKGKLKPKADDIEAIIKLGQQISCTTQMESFHGESLPEVLEHARDLESNGPAIDAKTGADRDRWPDGSWSTAFYTDGDKNTPVCVSVSITNENGEVGSTLQCLPLQWLKSYKLLGGKKGIMSTFAFVGSFHFELEKPNFEFFTGNQSSPLGAFSRLPYALWKMYNSENGYSYALRTVLGEAFYSKFTPFYKIFGDSSPEYKDDRVVLKGTDFATVFAAHALVYGVLTLHGQCKRISVIASLASCKFEQHVKGLENSSFMERLNQTHHDFYDNAHIVFGTLATFDKWFGICAPLLAGNLLSVTTFVTSLNWGFDVRIESFSRRTVLHLYNALRQIGMVPRIEFLDTLLELFSNDIWPVHGRPEAMGFLKAFLMINGDSSRVVDRVLDFMEVDDSDQDRILGELGYSSDRRRSTAPKPHSDQYLFERVTHLFRIRNRYHSVRPRTRGVHGADLSPAFTAVVKRKGLKRTSKSGNDYDLVKSCSERADFLKKAISEDQARLRLNWVKVGFHLSEFQTAIYDSLCITELTTKFSVCNKWRVLSKDTEILDVSNRFLADMVFREIEFGYNERRNSAIVASHMTEYFTKTATLENTSLF